MAESSDHEKRLNMELENRLHLYENNLDIHAFEHMLDNPSDGYKFYWLEAILKLLTCHSERRRFTFAEIGNQMIADAYFSANEYHLSLGFGKDVSGLQRTACL